MDKVASLAEPCGNRWFSDIRRLKVAYRFIKGQSVHIANQNGMGNLPHQSLGGPFEINGLFVEQAKTHLEGGRFSDANVPFGGTISPKFA